MSSQIMFTPPGVIDTADDASAIARRDAVTERVLKGTNPDYSEIQLKVQQLKEKLAKAEMDRDNAMIAADAMKDLANVVIAKSETKVTVHNTKHEKAIDTLKEKLAKAEMDRDDAMIAADAMQDLANVAIAKSETKVTVHSAKHEKDIDTLKVELNYKCNVIAERNYEIVRLNNELNKAEMDRDDAIIASDSRKALVNANTTTVNNHHQVIDDRDRLRIQHAELLNQLIVNEEKELISAENYTRLLNDRNQLGHDKAELLKKVESCEAVINNTMEARDFGYQETKNAEKEMAKIIDERNALSADLKWANQERDRAAKELTTIIEMTEDTTAMDLMIKKLEIANATIDEDKCKTEHLRSVIGRNNDIITEQNKAYDKVNEKIKSLYQQKANDGNTILGLYDIIDSKRIEYDNLALTHRICENKNNNQKEDIIRLRAINDDLSKRIHDHDPDNFCIVGSDCDSMPDLEYGVSE
jgi:hypothetical protein